MSMQSYGKIEEDEKWMMVIKYDGNDVMDMCDGSVEGNMRDTF